MQFQKHLHLQKLQTEQSELRETADKEHFPIKEFIHELYVGVRVIIHRNFSIDLTGKL
jgi:hypothetical protein